MFHCMIALNMIQRRHCIRGAQVSHGCQQCYVWSTWRQDLGGVTKASLNCCCYWRTCILKGTRCQKITTRRKIFCVQWEWSTRRSMHALMIAYCTEMSMKNATVPYEWAITIQSAAWQIKWWCKQQQLLSCKGLLVSSNNTKV